MHEDLPAHVYLYRATLRTGTWRKLLEGKGAYFTNVGRYNVTHQPTVYASDDPLVAISEHCYYQAREAQRLIGSSISPRSPKFPLVSKHYLWCFTLTDPIKLIDLRSPIAQKTFSYSPSLLTIPSHDYQATQKLANDIRTYPSAAKPFAQGMRAPSVRTLSPNGVATQIVLFPRLTKIKAFEVECCDLTVEFLDHAKNPVTDQTESIDRADPRFQLQGGKKASPLISDCLAGASIPRDSWQTIHVRFV